MYRLYIHVYEKQSNKYNAGNDINKQKLAYKNILFCDREPKQGSFILAHSDRHTNHYTAMALLSLYVNFNIYKPKVLLMLIKCKIGSPMAVKIVLLRNNAARIHAHIS